MKKKILLKRILHRDQMRLAIFFQFDDDTRSLIKSMGSVTFSKTHRCFYMDDNEANLKTILQTFRDGYDIDITALSLPSEIRKVSKPENSEIITLPKNEIKISQPVTIKSIDGVIQGKKIEKDVILTINEHEGLLLLKFPGGYDEEWMREIKTYGRPFYNNSTKEWSIKWSRIAVDSLSDYFSNLGLSVSARKSESPAEIKELREEKNNDLKNKDFNLDARDGIENMRDLMKEKRYSINTIESYISHLGTFFRYFSDKDPQKINGEDVTLFFNDFVSPNKYSASYQNQVISAIKLYYSVNPGEFNRSFNTGRPRRSRSLPKVFSKEEVSKILNSTRNIKHRLILWMIYSCGLRRSEVINIKIRDLERDRSVLNIIAGKGMVDRVVPVSAKVWEKIDEYIESYNPKQWLFEGQSNGRYSSESVYRIFKDALKRAGINKEVGVHCLRHSYATHLHENGLDIRYIQELLGHRSTRTTEIYTHVSRRNLLQVRSPIDDLDLK